MVRRLFRVLQRCRLKDANFILVSGRNLSRVRAAIDSRDTHIVVNGPGNDLDPLEIAGQYHNVASCGVGLMGRERGTCNYFPLVILSSGFASVWFISRLIVRGISPNRVLVIQFQVCLLLRQEEYCGWLVGQLQ